MKGEKKNWRTNLNRCYDNSHALIAMIYDSYLELSLLSVHFNPIAASFKSNSSKLCLHSSIWSLLQILFNNINFVVGYEDKKIPNQIVT